MAPSSPPSSDGEKPKNSRARPGNTCKHLAKHQWKPGQSGNPSGANTPTIKQQFAIAAREYGNEALETLVKCMRQKMSWDVRLRAATELLNRGYGKPVETIETDQKSYVAFVPLPIEREAWLSAVQKHRVNGANGVTIEQQSPTEPGNPLPSKLNS